MSHKSILIIDDDSEIRSSLADILEDEGFNILQAGNGLEGMQVLESLSDLPCMILLDLMMPVMDGQAFRGEQLRNPKLAAIPTILFSADGQLNKKAENIGIEEYVKKPIDLTVLLNLTDKYC